MIKVNFSPRLENGDYRVEDISDKGFVNGKIDVKPEELPQLMEELSKEDNTLLDVLRFMYSNFEVRSMSFEDIK